MPSKTNTGEKQKKKILDPNIFKALFDAAGEGLVVADTKGIIQIANPRAESMFGYEQNELIGQPIEVLVPEKQRDHHKKDRNNYHEDPRRRSMGLGLDLRARMKNGKTFPVEISLNYFGAGNNMLIMAMITDITERKKNDIALKKAHQALKKYNTELERSNEELEQFAYVASHDLQEPLRMVSSYTQLLERRYKDKLDEDANEFIHYAVDGAKRMQTLINDLLVYSRVGTRGSLFENVKLEEILGVVQLNLKQLIEDTDAKITIGKIPEINGDKTQLIQLFQNLIANAIKFRKKDIKPEIAISFSNKNDQLECKIKDNGIGMDPKYGERIFMIFQRLHHKSEYPGSGIGLAVCKKIVQRHGGKIWFESEPQKGTVFHFTLSK